MSQERTSARGWWKNSSWGLPMFALGIGAVTVAAALVLIPQVPERVLIETQRPAGGTLKSESACGAESLVTVELLPDAVVTKKGRQAVEYHAEIRNNRDNAVGIAWEVDILDDRGGVVQSKLVAESSRAAAKELTLTGAVLKELGDGFYAIRVRVAASAANEPSDVVEAIQYVQVTDGQWVELTDAEWRKLSRATLAYSEAELSGGLK